MSKNDTLCQHDITPSCTDQGYSKCPHCSLDLCLEHIIEHQQLIRTRFIEVIDQINNQKAESNNHLTIDEMKVKALAELDNWKTSKIETIITIHAAEQIRIEQFCEQCINEKSKIQNARFEELNVASNTIEKMKNIHPRGIIQLEQKLNELNTLIKKIEEKTNVKLTSIVKNIKLPEMINVEQRIKKIQETIKNTVEDYQKIRRETDCAVPMIRKQLSYSGPGISEKDQKIDILMENLRRCTA